MNDPLTPRPSGPRPEPKSYAPYSRFSRFANFVVHRSRLILLVFVSLAVLALIPLKDLRFHSSSETYANENDPALTALRRQQEIFSSEDPIIVAAIGETSVFSQGRLDHLFALHKELAEMHGVAKVWSIADTGFARNVDGHLEIAPFISDALQADQDRERLRNEALESPILSRLLISEDERTALFIVEPEAEVGDPLKRPEALVRELDRLRKTYEGPGRLALAGHPYTATIVGETSRHDVFVFAPLTGLLLVILLVYLYRSFWAAFIPLIASSVVSMIVLAVQVLRGRDLSEMDSMLPTLFTSIGVAYSMHLLDRYASVDGSVETKTHAALHKVVLPIIISGVTTVAGFMALALSGSSGVRSFGALGALGVGLVTLTVVFVVPALLVVARPNLSRTPRGKLVGASLRAFETNAREHPFAIVAGFVAFVILAAFGANRLSIDNSIVDWLPSGHPARTDVGVLDDAGIGTNLTYLTIDTGTNEGALDPQVLGSIRRLSDQLEALPYVTSTLSLEPFLRELHQAASGNHTENIPDSRALLSQYMLLIDSSDLSTQVQSFIDFDRRYLRVAIRTTLRRSTEWWPAKEQIQELILQELPQGEVDITGSFVVLFESTDEIASEQVRSLVAAIAIIIFALILALRSVRWGLLAIPSNVIPVLAIFGAMGWAGIPLDSINSIIACTILGIIVDDSVHFVVSYRDALHFGRRGAFAVEEAFRIAGRPILFTSIAIVGSFLVFLASSFESVFQIGVLASVSIITALFADLLLLPVLLRSLGGSEPIVAPQTRHEARRLGPKAPAMIQLASLLRDTPGYLDQCRARYGPTFELRTPGIAPRLCFLTRTADVEAAFGLSANDATGQANWVIRRLLGEESVLFLEGSEHTRVKRLLHTSMDKAAKSASVPRLAVESAVASWRAGEIRYMTTELTELTMSVSFDLVFGKNHQIETRQFGKAVRDLLRAVVVPRLTPTRLDHLAPAWSYAGRRRTVDRLIETELSRDTPAGEGGLIHELGVHEEEGQIVVLDHVLSLLIASFDTVSVTLAWAIYYILADPELHSRVVSVARSGSTEDLLMRNVVLEATRLRPVMPFFARTMVRETSFTDTTLQAGESLALCPWLTQRDPDIWDAPLTFNTERFGDSPPPRSEWMPFGGGTRKCLGMAHAMGLMPELLTALFSRLDVELLPGYQPHVVRRGFLLTPSGGVPIVVKQVR